MALDQQTDLGTIPYLNSSCEASSDIYSQDARPLPTVRLGESPCGHESSPQHFVYSNWGVLATSISLHSSTTLTSRTDASLEVSPQHTTTNVMLFSMDSGDCRTPSDSPHDPSAATLCLPPLPSPPATTFGSPTHREITVPQGHADANTQTKKLLWTQDLLLLPPLLGEKDDDYVFNPLGIPLPLPYGHSDIPPYNDQL